MCISELAALPPEMLSQLLERKSLKKTIRRIGRKNLPPNLKSIDDLRDVPELNQHSLTGEKFLLFDSRPKDYTIMRARMRTTKRKVAATTAATTARHRRDRKDKNTYAKNLPTSLPNSIFSNNLYSD